MAQPGNPKKHRTSGGTSRANRMLPALEPDSLLIDDRSNSRKINQAFEFARLFKFYSPTNAVDGSWQDLLEKDLTFVVASIVETDTNQWAQTGKKLSQQFAKTPYTFEKEQLLAELFLNVLELGGKLAYWLRSTGSLLEDPLQAHDRLLEIVGSNVWNGVVQWKTCWESMFKIFDQNPSSLVQRPLEQMLYEVFPTFEELFSDQVQGKKIALDTRERQFQFTHRLFRSLIKATAQVRNTFKNMLEQSLELSNHQPHNSLLLAFIQMMEVPTEVLNGFTRQHLDFYYQEVLQLEPLPGIPDQILLSFKLKKGAGPTLIPKGALLSPGPGPSNKPILYAVDRELVVHRAEVKEIMSVYNGGKTGTIPEDHKLYAAPKANSFNGEGGKYPAKPHTWAPMGEEQADKKVASMPDAKVGLAVSDPVLLMSQGERELRVYMKLSEDVFEDLQVLLETLGPDDQDFAYTFQELAGFAFDIWCTSKKGWLKIPLVHPMTLFTPAAIPDDLIQTDPLAKGISLKLSLDHAQPGFEPFKAKVHGTGFPEGIPVLKLVLDQDRVHSTFLPDPKTGLNRSVELSPYNLLASIQVEGYEIVSQVTGKKDMTLSGPLGKVAPGKPFHAFGAKAEQGNEFYIGSFEVFAKTLEALELDLNWKSLPDTSKGFADYYSTYNQADPDRALHNASFKGEADILINGSWIALRQQNGLSDFPLFSYIPLFEESNKDVTTKAKKTTGSPDPYQWLLLNRNAAATAAGTGGGLDLLEKDGKLQDLTRLAEFDLSATQHKGQFPTGADPVPMYEPGAVNGYFRIRLASPEAGFGNDLYAEARNWATQQTANAIASKSSLVTPQPKPPLSPEIKSILLNYTARSVLDIGKSGNPERLFHLRPFGVVSAPAVKTVTLLSEMEGQGTMYLGVVDVEAPQVLSLLVEVDEMSGNTILDPPEIEWSWMENGQWVSFSKSQVLLDTTGGLLRSGILEFDILRGPTSTEGWFSGVQGSGEMLWIRGVVQENVSALCRIGSVTAQAGTATYVMGPDAMTHLAKPLAPHKISKFYRKVPGIGKVVQPLASTGGTLPEAIEQFYIRIHERLRHRERAVECWDYERIVLQEFSQVGLVRCLPHISGTKADAPGDIMVAVFPEQLGKSLAQRLSPKLGHYDLVEIREFLVEHASDSINIEVRNPAYEYLQVLATVEIKMGLDPGYYLDKLNDELITFISPWSQPGNSQNPFQTRISRASILKFIEEREYVTAVDRFSVLQFIDGKPQTFLALPGEFDRILPSKAWGILSSPSKHLLFQKGAVIQDASYPLVVMPIPNPAYKVEESGKVASSTSGKGVTTDDQKAKAQEPEKAPINCFTIKPATPHG